MGLSIFCRTGTPQSWWKTWEITCQITPWLYLWWTNHFALLDTRISVCPSVRPSSCSGYPPWILKQGGLESSGQRLISSNGKNKIIAPKTSLILETYRMWCVEYLLTKYCINKTKLSSLELNKLCAMFNVQYSVSREQCSTCSVQCSSCSMRWGSSKEKFLCSYSWQWN